MRFVQNSTSLVTNNTNSSSINNSQLLVDENRQRMLNSLMRQIQNTNQIGIAPNILIPQHHQQLIQQQQQQQQQQQEQLYDNLDYHKPRQLSVSPISNASSRSSSSCSLSCSTSPCSKQTNIKKEPNSNDHHQTSPKIIIQDDDLNNSNSSNSNVWRPW